MKIFKLFFILLIFTFVITKVNSQNPPCLPYYNGLTFQANNLESVPPITFSMPYEVILGYLALDTLRKYSTPNDMLSFLERQSYNDTMQYLMKYYYKMVDYDPLKYKLTLYYPEEKYIFPVDIDNYLLDNIERVSPYPLIDGMLFRSHIIAHILVTDTVRRIDTSSKFFPTSIIVTSQVIDTIKGKVFPTCNNYYQSIINKGNGNIELVIPQIPNNCLQFQYRLNWERGNEYSGLNLIDSTGNTWIRENHEYIVFLRYDIICNDSTFSYFDLSPFVKYSLTCTMYPITNGLVYDPGNEFGFGIGLTVNQFKSFLRNRISQITNY